MLLSTNWELVSKLACYMFIALSFEKTPQHTPQTFFKSTKLSNCKVKTETLAKIDYKNILTGCNKTRSEN